MAGRRSEHLEAAMTPRTFISIATERSTVLRAARIALLVGFILVAINQGGKFLSGCVDTACLISSCLTFVVPYCVSTVSTVLARAEEKTRKPMTN